MNDETILFCEKNENIKKAILYQNEESQHWVAFIPCPKHMGTKGKKKRIKTICRFYKKSGATHLWMTEDLCAELGVENLEMPAFYLEQWFDEIPFYPTRIYADDEKGIVQNYLLKRTDKVAVLVVICYKEYVNAYEQMAEKLYEREGLILQILTYDRIRKSSGTFSGLFVQKGNAVILDFHKGYMLKNMNFSEPTDYYSFWKDVRLFLDTFQKNRYNTLTK